MIDLRKDKKVHIKRKQEHKRYSGIAKQFAFIIDVSNDR